MALGRPRGDLHGLGATSGRPYVALGRPRGDLTWHCGDLGATLHGLGATSGPLYMALHGLGATLGRPYIALERPRGDLTWPWGDLLGATLGVRRGIGGSPQCPLACQYAPRRALCGANPPPPRPCGECSSWAPSAHMESAQRPYGECTKKVFVINCLRRNHTRRERRGAPRPDPSVLHYDNVHASARSGRVRAASSFAPLHFASQPSGSCSLDLRNVAVQPSGGSAQLT
eukprot:gene2240-biopygen7951